MPSDNFIAIDGNALLSKSKVYISRALSKKQEEDYDQYQLWASLALELLGKAALAKIHPCLIVDPSKNNSIFAAAGIIISTDIKTIMARTLIDRLATLIPKFDKAMQEFCQRITQRRNAELHSAETPFQAMHLNAWEARYWHACDVILSEMDSSLEQWLGADNAEPPRQVLENYTAALVSAIEVRISDAKKSFNSLTRRKKEELANQESMRDIDDMYGSFERDYDGVWECICPACECRAFMSGEQVGEEITEEYDYDRDGEGGYMRSPPWELVDREFYGEEFQCKACGLQLIGDHELTAAGLEQKYCDQQEREIEYEPEYGND